MFLRSPYGGEIRALIIGIDAYRHVRPLKGAVADAVDIEGSLRKVGVRDVTVLINGNANRASFLTAINQLVARTGPRDQIVLSLAGHGAQEPEKVRGANADGVENVFLLGDFEDTPAGSQERVLGVEFNYFLKQFEARGAHVIFIADTCYGGGMTRSLDPRWQQMSFRHVPSYRVSNDLLQPVITKADEVSSEFDFSQTAFLAAVDRKTMAPEVEIPGIPGLRGALSYAVARTIEDSDPLKDNRITLKQLFAHVRQVVYQLSDERQNIVTTAPRSTNPDTEVVFERVRSVNIGTLSVSNAGPGQGGTGEAERPIKVAPLNGNDAALKSVKPQQAQFRLVAPVDNPDLTWDPVSHDVLSWGDVVAYGIEPSGLPSVIDRAAAIRALKMIAGKAPQPIKVMPDDGLHHDSTRVQVQISDVAGRSLILFNIAGDGTVEMLYPVGADPAVIQSAEYKFPVRVEKPFGSDQLVAVTSVSAMPLLKQAVQQLDKRKAALQVIDTLKRYAPEDARIGSAGIFTAP
jgi:hypothetical protein